MNLSLPYRGLNNYSMVYILRSYYHHKLLGKQSRNLSSYYNDLMTQLGLDVYRASQIQLQVKSLARLYLPDEAYTSNLNSDSAIFCQLLSSSFTKFLLRFKGVFNPWYEYQSTIFTSSFHLPKNLLTNQSKSLDLVI